MFTNMFDCEGKKLVTQYGDFDLHNDILTVRKTKLYK